MAILRNLNLLGDTSWGVCPLDLTEKNTVKSKKTILQDLKNERTRVSTDPKIIEEVKRLTKERGFLQKRLQVIMYMCINI
jgi:hypothetical protein